MTAELFSMYVQNSSMQLMRLYFVVLHQFFVSPACCRKLRNVAGCSWVNVTSPSKFSSSAVKYTEHGSSLKVLG